MLSRFPAEHLACWGAAGWGAGRRGEDGEPGPQLGTHWQSCALQKRKVTE